MALDFRKEKGLKNKGFNIVVGVDEVGRGPLAGPVVACALFIEEFNKTLPKVKDSKKLSERQRVTIYKELRDNPLVEWGIGRVSEKIIDRINILRATKLAMRRAVINIGFPVDYIILDGNFLINLPIQQQSVVKADNIIFSCAAASIIAKVTRDRIMSRYHTIYPEYGFDSHKGYGTKLHIKRILKYGPSRIHRLSFRPILGR